MQYVSLTELKAALETASENESLVLTPALLPDDVVAQWLATLPASGLTLMAPSYSLTATELVLSGTTQDQLVVPQYQSQGPSTVGMGRVSITFSQSGPNAPIYSELSWDDIQWVLEGTTYTGTGTVATTPQLNYIWTPETPLPTASYSDLIRKFSDGLDATHFPPGFSLFDEVTLSELSVKFAFSPGSTCQTKLGSTLGEDWTFLSDDSLTLAAPQFHYQAEIARPVDEPPEYTALYSLVGSVSIGGDTYIATLDIPGLGAWNMEVRRDEDLALPGLTDLARLVGGDSLVSTVSGLLDALPVSNLALEYVAVQFNPFTRTLVNVLLFGHFDFFDGRIDFRTSLPDFSISASLHLDREHRPERATGPIRIQPIIEQYFGSSLSFPDTVLSGLSFNTTLTEGDYSITVAMDDLLQIPVGYNSLSLDKLELTLLHSAGETEGSLSGVFTMGGVIFSTYAQYSTVDGWAFSGEVTHGDISFVSFTNGLLSFFDTQLPANVPDITITDLGVSFTTVDEDFQFQAATDSEIEIPFLTGPEAHIMADVFIESKVDSATGNRQISGYLEGDFVIDDCEFLLQYSFGKESHVFVASWASATDENGNYLHTLGVHTFLDAMGIDLTIPEGIDLDLGQIYFQYTAESETLELVANSANYGDAYLIVSKLPLGQLGSDQPVPEDMSTAPWQYILGWAYTDVTKLSDIPGVGSFFAPADMFTMKEVSLVVASMDVSQFEIPVMPAMRTITPGVDASENPPAPADVRRPVGQGTVVAVKAGFNLVAVIDIDQSSGSDVEALTTVVPVPELEIYASFTPPGFAGQPQSLALSAKLGGSLTIPTGGATPLELTNARLTFKEQAGEFVFEAAGDVVMTFDHETITITAAIDIQPTEFEFRANVDFGSTGWVAPMGIQGLTLDEVGFELGVNLLPVPGLNIGLEGQSHIGSQPQSSDNFAFVLEIIEEIPDPLLLSFYLEEISVATALQIFTPDVDTSTLPDAVKDLSAQQVNVYFAESTVTMPDGNLALPGFRFSGILDILGFQAYGSIAVDTQNGLAGSFETSPIHLGNILSITGNSQGVFLNEADGKPLPLNILDSEAPDPATVSQTQVVAPGGPLLAFQTTASPYLVMSLQASFLDLAHVEVEALVTNSSIDFLLDYDIGGLVLAGLNFSVSSSGFEMHSYFGMHLEFDVGPVEILGIDFGTLHVDSGFDISLDVSLNLDQFYMKISGDFDFEGLHLTFPDIELSVAPQSLFDLPTLIIDWIIDKAETVFQTLYDEATEIIEEGLEAVEELAEEAETAITDLAEAAEEEAEEIYHEAEEAVNSALNEVEAQVVELEQEAQQILDDAQAVVTEIAQETEAAVEEIVGEIEDVVTHAEEEIEAIATEIAQETQEVVADVAQFAQEAEQEVEAIAQAVAQEVQQLLDDARAVAQSFIDAAQQVVDTLLAEAAHLWEDVESLARQIEEAAAKVVNAVEDTAKSVWHTISKY